MIDRSACPYFQETAEPVGRRWVGAIVRGLEAWAHAWLAPAEHAHA
jgi:hypothetical protein